MAKKYNDTDAAKILAKSMWKSVKKAIAGKNPVQDVLDPNFKPEADQTSIPPARDGVMYKSKKLKEFLDKRKLKVKNKLKQ